MQRHLTTLLATIFFITAGTSAAWAQYNSVAGQSAPKAMEEVVDIDSDGRRTTRTVEAEPQRDNFGNAAGATYDLAVDGAFEGQTVAVLHLYTGEGFDFSKPKAALAQKGFSVFRWINQPPPADELAKKLEKASQLWLISGTQRLLNEQHLAVIKKFFDSGKGVYIWGDNTPYHADANYVAAALFDSDMRGYYTGDRVVHTKLKNTNSGVLPNHLLTTGLEHIFEGITIAQIKMSGGLKPLIWSSDGNVVTAFYDRGGKRAILDGGFTRLYLKWDTAGTGRYVKNAAAWLANYERFGDDIVAKR